MVLPVPGIEFLDDAVIPEPARRFFTWLRYALITEIVFAIFRLCLGTGSTHLYAYGLALLACLQIQIFAVDVRGHVDHLFSTGDIAGSISDFICILFGVFFMRSDEVIGSMYRYLRNTMIAMCCGGGTILVFNIVVE